MKPMTTTPVYRSIGCDRHHDALTIASKRRGVRALEARRSPGETIMRSKTSVVLFFASIGFLASCEKKIDNPLSDPHPAIKNTVFTAKPTKEGSLVSPIGKSYTNEIPPRYLMKHEFGNLGIEVGYQYIGKGIVSSCCGRLDQLF